MCLTADNVGDNVGDIAGMGADLFGSFAEATCAALVISSVSTLGTEHVYVAMMYPLLISAVGLLVCLLTTLVATDLKPARGINEIESTLKLQLIVSTLLATPVSSCHCSWSLLCPTALIICGLPCHVMPECGSLVQNIVPCFVFGRVQSVPQPCHLSQQLVS